MYLIQYCPDIVTFHKNFLSLFPKISCHFLKPSRRKRALSFPLNSSVQIDQLLHSFNVSVFSPRSSCHSGLGHKTAVALEPWWVSEAVALPKRTVWVGAGRLSAWAWGARWAKWLWGVHKLDQYLMVYIYLFGMRNTYICFIFFPLCFLTWEQ